MFGFWRDGRGASEVWMRARKSGDEKRCRRREGPRSAPAQAATQARTGGISSGVAYLQFAVCVKQLLREQQAGM